MSLRVPRWTRCVRHGFASASFLGLRVRILPGTWMCVCCEWPMLSGRFVWVGLITRSEESYRLWCLNMIVKPRMMRRPWPFRDCRAMKNKISLWLGSSVLNRNIYSKLRFFKFRSSRVKTFPDNCNKISMAEFDVPAHSADKHKSHLCSCFCWKLSDEWSGEKKTVEER